MKKEKLLYIAIGLTILLSWLPVGNISALSVSSSQQTAVVQDDATKLEATVTQKAGTTNTVTVANLPTNYTTTGTLGIYPVVISATSTGITTNAMIRDAVTNVSYCVDIYNNEAAQALCVNLGTTATTSVFSYKIPAGETRRLPPYPSKIYAIAADGTMENSAVVTTYNVTTP